MAMFNVTPREATDAAYPLLMQPADVTARQREESADTFEGVGSGLMTGVYRGWSRAAASAAVALTPALEAVFGKTDYLENERDKAVRSLMESKLDPKTVGAAGQIVGSVADALTTFAATRNPALAGAVYGSTQAGIHMNEGVDPTTAIGMGTIEGTGFGVMGAVAPSLPGSLAMRALSGGGMNAALGITERFALGEWLASRGNNEMAAQYKAFDSTQMMADIVLGAAFGVLLGPRGKAPDVPPSAVDAALVAKQAKHAEIDTAPGIPTTTAARQAHAAALDESLTALAEGRPVNVQEIMRVADQSALDSPAFDAKLEPKIDLQALVQSEIERAGAPAAMAELKRAIAEAEKRGITPDAEAVELARSGEKTASADVDPSKIDVTITAIDENGRTVAIKEKADVALKDNADRLERMKGLLECVGK